MVVYADVYLSDDEIPDKTCDKILVLPSTDYVTEGAFERIESYIRGGGKMVVLGNALSFDEYGRERDRAEEILGLEGVTKVGRDAEERGLRRLFMGIFEDVGEVPLVVPLDLETGKVAWGVEWLAAEFNGYLIVNAVNLTKEPKCVRFETPESREVEFRRIDLITGKEIKRKEITGDIRMGPLEPLLMKL